MINNLPRIISITVMIGAVLVILGWIFNIPILESILPQFVTIKFLTAICFLLSGILLFVMVRVTGKNRDWDEMLLLFIAFLILLIMVALILSMVLGITTGLENLFVVELPGTIETPVPGRPALITTIDFIFVGISGLIVFSKIGSLLKLIRIFGAFIFFSGLMAVLGYTLNIPEFYFSIGNFSSAVALYTAFLFILLGIGFFILKTDQVTKD